MGSKGNTIATGNQITLGFDLKECLMYVGGMVWSQFKAYEEVIEMDNVISTGVDWTVLGFCVKCFEMTLR